MDSMEDDLKSKISSKLNSLNQRSIVFDNIINDYNILYKKYTEIQLRNEGNPYMTKLKIDNVQDQGELEKLKEDYLKIKKEKEEYIVKVNNYVQEKLDLLKTIEEKDKKIEAKDKKINGILIENHSLKEQFKKLNQDISELTETKIKHEKLLATLKKSNQRYQIDYRKLIDNSGKMHMEIENLKNKILELQANKDKKPENIKSEINTSRKYSSEIKIPKQLIYKQKIHNNDITNINFNKSGSSYLTIGEDSIIRVFDITKNNETNSFADSSKKFIGACYDHKEELLFAGVDDKTANLWSLKNNELLHTFSGHNNNINCVNSFNYNEYGLTGSSDKTVKQWDFNTKNLMRKFKLDNECHSIDVGPNDSYILCGQVDGTVKMWGTNDEQEKSFIIHKDKVISIKIINDNNFLTLGKDKTIKLFDMKNEKVVYTIDESKIPEINERSIAISPDKKLFAIGSKKGLIYFINIIDGKISANINNGSVTTLNWNPHNSHLYIGDSNGFLSVWE